MQLEVFGAVVDLIVDDDPNSDYYGMPLKGGDGKIGEVTPKFLVGFNNSFKYKFVIVLNYKIFCLFKYTNYFKRIQTSGC